MQEFGRPDERRCGLNAVEHLTMGAASFLPADASVRTTRGYGRGRRPPVSLSNIRHVTTRGLTGLFFDPRSIVSFPLEPANF